MIASAKDSELFLHHTKSLFWAYAQHTNQAWWNKGAVDTRSVAAPANTSTVPTDGAPAYVIKTGKNVVCADFYLPDNSAREWDDCLFVPSLFSGAKCRYKAESTSRQVG